MRFRFEAPRCPLPCLTVAAALAVFLLAQATPIAAETAMRIGIQQSPLAGADYHQLDAVLDEIKVGDPLRFEREPNNRFDRRAIKVFWRSTQLGYLPRKQNRAIAEAMDQGVAVVGSVVAIRKDPDPWRRLLIDVWLQF